MALKYYIDKLAVDHHFIRLQGWACGTDPEAEVNFSVTFFNGFEKQIELKHEMRPDVAEDIFHQEIIRGIGFNIRFLYNPERTYHLEMKCGEETASLELSPEWIRKFQRKTRIVSLIHRYHVFEVGSVQPTWDISYADWCDLTWPTENDYKRQRKYKWGKDAPKFSIVIPLYRTRERFLKELLDSIVSQTYDNWELCLADGSGNDRLKPIIDSYRDRDSRIRYQLLKENQGISENTNEAIRMATGDFIVFCDHDDLLRKDALFQMASAIVKHPDVSSLYSDEDKTDEETKSFFEAHFKPDFNADMLRSENYICHLFVTRRSNLQKYGMLRPEYDGSQDFDLVLRLTEHERKVIHIPEILYHWRSFPESTSKNTDAKLWAFEAGGRAIADHYRRDLPEIRVDDIVEGCQKGIYHTLFHFDEYSLVSVVIAGDYDERMKKLLASMDKSTWKNLEYIIVADRDISDSEMPEHHDRYHFLHYENNRKPSVLNYGASKASGKYILFLDPDLEMLEPSSIEEMAGYCQREDVGVTGCRIQTEERRFLHAGMIVGMNGSVDTLFDGQSSDPGWTYFNGGMTAQNYLAVSSSAMLVKKENFELAHGFDESFEKQYFDADFCLRLRNKQDLKTVYTPYACFTGESKSVSEKNEKDRILFTRRYADLLKQGDPYYNVNLSLHKKDYSLRNPVFEPYPESCRNQ